MLSQATVDPDLAERLNKLTTSEAMALGRQLGFKFDTQDIAAIIEELSELSDEQLDAISGAAGGDQSAVDVADTSDEGAFGDVMQGILHSGVQGLENDLNNFAAYVKSNAEHAAAIRRRIQELQDSLTKKPGSLIRVDSFEKK